MDSENLSLIVMDSCHYYFYCDSQGGFLIQVDYYLWTKFYVPSIMLDFFVSFSELAELRKQIEEEIKASVSYNLQNIDLMTFPSLNNLSSLT